MNDQDVIAHLDLLMDLDLFEEPDLQEVVIQMDELSDSDSSEEEGVK